MSVAPPPPVQALATGLVRHPDGNGKLMETPDEKGMVAVRFLNRTPVVIRESRERWFNVEVRGLRGWMHHNWVKVDGFAEAPFEHRRVQIKSFAELSDVRRYLSSHNLALDSYLASNGWRAITLRGTYERQRALDLRKMLKASGEILDDSIITFGNTYAEKLCCD